MQFPAIYFDGRSAKHHDVLVDITDRIVRIFEQSVMIPRPTASARRVTTRHGSAAWRVAVRAIPKFTGGSKFNVPGHRVEK